ncbi:MAG: penicillin-binding protein 2, partial [Actinobacteria bacterium]|nr:penicillin-binding protein 2 [Actinomycetota bacterium]NIS32547.1 penicillin-binding protein 2 [Actinomycetota bacterium]NIU67565.1 penicillin-binding protein 2 [Actinomycetota bacterium]NIW29324.1 penicillin-binding protein 2 [Actinomycetota bacterium]NIX21835.1 penicillin-binding protein 2 [Actinomycetota bacterium]
MRRLLGDDLEPDDVQVTIDTAVQRAAAEALGSQRGAVVALDARTGRIVAWVSSPSYDPGLLTGPAAFAEGESLGTRDDLP